MPLDIDENAVDEPDNGGGAGENPSKTEYELPVLRDAKGWFMEGTSPGPGRHPSSWGRVQALRVLDDLVSNSENQVKLRDAMQHVFDENPVRFFKSIIMPLLPRSALLGVELTNGMAATLKIISGVDGDRL